MSALPKRKYSKSRQGKRRSHSALSLPHLESCPKCHHLKLCHHVCPNCGSYNRREVIETTER